MSWTLNANIGDVEDGEEDTLNSYNSFTGRGSVIYLIDAHIDNDDQFRLCLDCIEADLLKNILINPRDLVSVVFYNTHKNPPPSTQLTEGEDTNTVVPPNCAIFIPLKPLSKDLIQYFKNFHESDDFFNFRGLYGSSNGSYFSEALWLCSRLIMRCNYRLFDSKIILFTNNELPHSVGEQQQAFIRARDLYDNQISVDLVPLVDEFDLDPFFKEFLSAVEGTEPEEFRCDLPIDQRFKLINRLHRRNYRKSCLRHINFEFVNDVSMSCDIFSLTRNAKKPNSVKILRENKEVVLAKRSYFVYEENSENPVKVLTSQLCKSQEICGKPILFSPEEIIAMKTIQAPGLRLLGFKPLNRLKQRWMIKHSWFLYPNEKRIGGSTILFRALWEKCLEKQKYALCTIILRRCTPPKYVALVPQTANNHGNDGFGIIYLPMETNIGALDSIVKSLPEPTPEQVCLFENLSKKLRFKYQCEMFSNPSLQSFCTHLEASVYDEELKEIEDLTLPDLNSQDKKIEPFLEQIDEEFGQEDEASGSRVKRRYDGETAGSRVKVSKKDLSAKDVEEAIRNGRMEAVTVQHLKDFIRTCKKTTPTGTKRVLFEFAEKLINRKNFQSM